MLGRTLLSAGRGARVAVAARTMASVSVQAKNDHFEFKSGNFEHRFLFKWLRDHCRSPTSYNHATNQRNSSILDIPGDLRPKNFNSDGSVFTVTWSDDHTSSFDLSWLLENSCSSKRSEGFKRKVEKAMWTGETFPNLNEISTAHSEFMSSDAGVARLVESILKYGVGVVDGTPATTADTKTVVERVAQVSKSIYGEMIELTNEGNPTGVSDTSYSNVALGAHTDTTYCTEAYGLQVFHCLEAATSGGENLFVDGFRVAAELHEKHLESYLFLSLFPVEAEYIHSNSSPGEYYLGLDTAFKHHPVSGDLEQFRFNVYDRAVHRMTLEEQRLFYKHYPILAGLVEDKRFEKQISLRPGQVLFVDNWRVMHGRTEFEGRRTMTTCYVARSDFLSRAKALKLI